MVTYPGDLLAGPVFLLPYTSLLGMNLLAFHEQIVHLVVVVKR